MQQVLLRVCTLVLFHLFMKAKSFYIQYGVGLFCMHFVHVQFVYVCYMLL